LRELLNFTSPLELPRHTGVLISNHALESLKYLFTKALNVSLKKLLPDTSDEFRQQLAGVAQNHIGQTLSEHPHNVQSLNYIIGTVHDFFFRSPDDSLSQHDIAILTDCIKVVLERPEALTELCDLIQIANVDHVRLTLDQNNSFQVSRKTFLDRLRSVDAYGNRPITFMPAVDYLWNISHRSVQNQSGELSSDDIKQSLQEGVATLIQGETAVGNLIQQVESAETAGVALSNDEIAAVKSILSAILTSSYGDQQRNIVTQVAGNNVELNDFIYGLYKDYSAYHRLLKLKFYLGVFLQNPNLQTEQKPQFKKYYDEFVQLLYSSHSPPSKLTPPSKLMLGESEITEEQVYFFTHPNQNWGRQGFSEAQIKHTIFSLETIQKFSRIIVANSTHSNGPALSTLLEQLALNTLNEVGPESLGVVADAVTRTYPQDPVIIELIKNGLFHQLARSFLEPERDIIIKISKVCRDPDIDAQALQELVATVCDGFSELDHQDQRLIEVLKNYLFPNQNPGPSEVQVPDSSSNQNSQFYYPLAIQALKTVLTDQSIRDDFSNLIVNISPIPLNMIREGIRQNNKIKSEFWKTSPALWESLWGCLGGFLAGPGVSERDEVLILNTILQDDVIGDATKELFDQLAIAATTRVIQDMTQEYCLNRLLQDKQPELVRIAFGVSRHIAERLTAKNNNDFLVVLQRWGLSAILPEQPGSIRFRVYRFALLTALTNEFLFEYVVSKLPKLTELIIQLIRRDSNLDYTQSLANQCVEALFVNQSDRAKISAKTLAMKLISRDTNTHNAHAGFDVMDLCYEIPLASQMRFVERFIFSIYAYRYPSQSSSRFILSRFVAAIAYSFISLVAISAVVGVNLLVRPTVMIWRSGFVQAIENSLRPVYAMSTAIVANMLLSPMFIVSRAASQVFSRFRKKASHSHPSVRQDVGRSNQNADFSASQDVGPSNQNVEPTTINLEGVPEERQLILYVPPVTAVPELQLVRHTSPVSIGQVNLRATLVFFSSLQHPFSFYTIARQQMSTFSHRVIAVIPRVHQAQEEDLLGVTRRRAMVSQIDRRKPVSNQLKSTSLFSLASLVFIWLMTRFSTNQMSVSSHRSFRRSRDFNTDYQCDNRFGLEDSQEALGLNQANYLSYGDPNQTSSNVVEGDINRRLSRNAFEGP
tara:strand:- start:614 stop:4093 length:3480 start_codon:yes stop_codon:yes gene_type:complete